MSARINANDVYGEVPNWRENYGNCDRPEYVLKNGKAVNCYGLLKDVQEFQSNERALRETLRLKELECQQLAQDKAELAEALSDVIDGQTSYDLIDITGLAHERCVEIVEMLEKNK